MMSDPTVRLGIAYGETIPKLAMLDFIFEHKTVVVLPGHGTETPIVRTMAENQEEGVSCLK